MFLTRQHATTKLPIRRKGTKYLVVPRGHHNDSVPVLIALRDMLGLAKTAKEAKRILHENEVKINGRRIFDHKEVITLFSVFEAGKHYILSLLPTGKYTFEETKVKDAHLTKVINKRLISEGKLQVNMYDGYNIITKEKLNINDSVYLDFSGKIKKHIPLKEGCDVIVISGKHSGKKGKVESIEGKKIVLNAKEGSLKIDSSRVMAI